MSYYDFPNLSPERRVMYQTLSIIEDSAAHAARLEAEKRAFAEQEKENAENEKLLAQHLEHSRREREAEARKLREESNKSLQVELRERFFRANPNALEADYLRVKDSLKDAYFVEKMKSEATSEDVVRNSGNYSRM